METSRPSGIDQAALLAALLTVFFQVTGEPGPWGPVNTVFGLILILFIAAYAEPSLTRRFARIHLQALAVAVGAAAGACLVFAWPAQETVVRYYAAISQTSISDDRLGDYTTYYVFPVVLLVTSSLLYIAIVRRLKVQRASRSTLSNTDAVAADPSASVAGQSGPWTGPGSLEQHALEQHGLDEGRL
jgi:hypothetical protein